MAIMAADTSDATADLAMLSGARVLASLTIPGRARHVSEARSFVGKVLGADNAAADVAVLLTSEIVTNAVVHSNSRRAFRSEEHTSELQSRVDLVCRLVLEKKK